MARKKRKKDRPDSKAHDQGWAPSEQRDPAFQPHAAASQKGAASDLPPGQNYHSPESDEPELEDEGIFDRITRWFTGSAPAYSPRSAPPSPPQKTPSPPPTFEPAKPEPEPPPPPAQRETPVSPKQPPAPEQKAPPGSKVDHVLAVLTLERVLPELDAARKQLEEMKASSDQRIRQLESELQAARIGTAGSSNAAEAEARLRSELSEARKTAESRIRQLEAERDQSRSELEQAGVAQDELKRRISELEAALGAKKASKPAGDSSALQVRIQAMEEALQETQTKAEQEREDSKVKIGQLEADRKKLEASLAAKEKKLTDALAQIEEVHEQAQQLEAEMARLREIEAERDQLSTRLTAQMQELQTASQQAERVPELEAELTEWKTRATTTSEPDKSSPPPKEAASASGPGSEAVKELYQNTMSRLTVIQASAELLSMNSKLDASSRDTAKDIRTESQQLSEIIKKFALPPDLRKAE